MATILLTSFGQRNLLWPSEDDAVYATEKPLRHSLTRDEREALEGRTRKYTLPYFQVVRALMILLAADGRSNDEIAAALSVGRDVVSLWRKRFFYKRFAGLEERHRPGRPRAFPPRGRRANQGSRV